MTLEAHSIEARVMKMQKYSCRVLFFRSCLTALFHEIGMTRDREAKSKVVL